MRKQLGSLLLIILGTLPLQAIRIAQDPDYSNYDSLLRSYVNADGLVDYQGLRTNSSKDLQDVLHQFAQTDLKEMDYRERLAYWINAYNANVLQQVLDRPKMTRIDQHPELFDTPLPVAKGLYSLNDIEHRIIRGKTNPRTGAGPIPDITLDIFDPRVHFALVNGTIDSPPLRNFAYTSQTLEETLRHDSADFVNSKKYVRIKNGRLHISALMNGYVDDFSALGGASSFLTRLVDPARRPDADELKKKLIADYRKADFVYDWTVNDIRHAPTKRPRLLRAPH